MKILLAGGGSGGPVTPVLAVALEIRKIRPEIEFLFVGTRTGPEKAMVVPTGIRFVSIPAARWRRFFSIKNIFAPFVFLAGFLKSLAIVRRFRPDAVFAAGSFVSVPVAWAARIFGSKIIIHQQDAHVGLANKLIAPIAGRITTAFEKTSKEFYSGSGAEWVGNPVRPDLFAPASDPDKFFNLHSDLPVLLVLGGATGAAQINALIGEILPNLVKVHQVVHQTGKGKNNLDFSDRNYHPFELIPFPEYAAILKLAHLVIARAGLSTIAELSALSKSAVIIPMPYTHQEDNAKILEDQGAAIVFLRDQANSQNLVKAINNLNFNSGKTQILSKNIASLIPKDAADRLAKIIIKQSDEDRQA